MTRGARAGGSPERDFDGWALGTTGKPQEPSQPDLVGARLDEIYAEHPDARPSDAEVAAMAEGAGIRLD